MKTFFQTCFLGIVFFLASDVFGQQSPVLSTDPPPAAPPRTIIKEVGKAKVSYVQSKDESVASSGSVQIFRDLEGWGNLSASAVSKGKSLSGPTTVGLSVFIAAGDRKFIDDLTLRLEADGKSLLKGKSELADGRTNGRQIYSSFKISLPLDDFRRLANAKQIKLTVGPSTFEIVLGTVSNFRDLLQIIDESTK